MDMQLREALKGSKVTGVYCSKCEFMIESAMPNWTNDDLFNAAGLHHAKFHLNESGDDRTSYDVRATRRIDVTKPIESIRLEIK
jgi:hypothetical protein